MDGIISSVKWGGFMVRISWLVPNSEENSGARNDVSDFSPASQRVTGVFSIFLMI